MFEENWQPRGSTIDYDGGTIHGGALKKYYTEDKKKQKYSSPKDGPERG
jgi:hypothetical protein